MKSACRTANRSASALLCAAILTAVVVVDSQRLPNREDRFNAQQRQQPGDFRDGGREDGGDVPRPTNDPSSGRFDASGVKDRNRNAVGNNDPDVGFDGGRFNSRNRGSGANSVPNSDGGRSRGQQQQVVGRERDGFRYGADQRQLGRIDGRYPTSSLTPWGEYPLSVVGLVLDVDGEPIPEPYNEDNEHMEPLSIREGATLVIQRFGGIYDPLLAENRSSSMSNSFLFVITSSLMATVLAAWASATKL